MLPSWLVFVAAAIRLAGGGRYIVDIFKDRARPNPISWFCWGLAALIAAVAQLADGVRIESVMTFAIGIGPMAVFVISLFKSRDKSHFTPSNLACGAIALVGILLWYLSCDPILAILFSIGADFISSLPTIHKSYEDPASEPFKPYALSVLAMFIALLTIENWTMSTYSYPIYMVIINVMILSARQMGLNKNKKRRKKK